jgi:hypothetical protein
MKQRSFLPNSRPRFAVIDQTPDDRAIPPDAQLHTIAKASAILTDQFQDGYSPASIRARIKRGREWRFGWHYTKTGNRYKIYIPAVQDWQVNQPAPASV